MESTLGGLKDMPAVLRDILTLHYIQRVHVCPEKVEPMLWTYTTHFGLLVSLKILVLNEVPSLKFKEWI